MYVGFDEATYEKVTGLTVKTQEVLGCGLPLHIVFQPI